MVRHAGILKVALIAITWASTAAFAQDKQGRLADGYPIKPIRVLVGVSAGGGLDTITRIVCQRLGERLGQFVVVDNRPGASSTIAMKLEMDAAPDGYTLMSATKTMILNGALKRVPYDILKAYAPIAQMTSQAYILVVHPSLPVKSVRDLIAYAKSKPGSLNYGSAGLGSLQHIGTERFKLMAGINMVHIPYRGGGPALIDLAGGQIQVMFTVTISAAPYLKNGRLRAIAIAGDRREEAYRDLPTVSESGVPGFELTNMYGLFAPAGTPQFIVSALNREVGRIMTLPELKNLLAADGVEAAVPSTPEQFRDTVTMELNKWAKFLQESKIKL